MDCGTKLIQVLCVNSLVELHTLLVVIHHYDINFVLQLLKLSRTSMRMRAGSLSPLLTRLVTITTKAFAGYFIQSPSSILPTSSIPPPSPPSLLPLSSSFSPSFPPPSLLLLSSSLPPAKVWHQDSGSG